MTKRRYRLYFREQLIGMHPWVGNFAKMYYCHVTGKWVACQFAL